MRTRLSTTNFSESVECVMLTIPAGGKGKEGLRELLLYIVRKGYKTMMADAMLDIVDRMTHVPKQTEAILIRDSPGPKRIQ